jgi:hypothetical protein
MSTSEPIVQGEIVQIKRRWLWAAAPLVVIAIELAGAAQFGTIWRGIAFLGAVFLLAIELAVIGWLVNGRPIGAFIDNRNRISLSKLQAGAWTVVVIGALSTAAVFNILAQGSNGGSITDLDITIPGELLLAMVISATSLVATPGLLSLKSEEEPTQAAISNVKAKLSISVVARTGKVFNRTAPAEASWSDLVTGDEVGNATSPDLGKIQQVLITVLLLGCYIGYVYIDLSRSAAPIDALPALDKSFVWLLGISHASYLAYKAAPHTQTA